MAGTLVSNLNFMDLPRRTQQGLTCGVLILGDWQPGGPPLARVLQAAVPQGMRLTHLSLRRCTLAPAALAPCAPLAALSGLELSSCRSTDGGGSVEGIANTLLEQCGAQLRRVLIDAPPEAPVLHLPPALLGCTGLRSLQLLCDGRSLDWPGGPYLAGACVTAALALACRSRTVPHHLHRQLGAHVHMLRRLPRAGLESLKTDGFASLPPALAQATSLVALLIHNEHFRLTAAAAQQLAALPRLCHLLLPHMHPDELPAARRLSQLAPQLRMRVLSSTAGSSGAMQELLAFLNLARQDMF